MPIEIACDAALKNRRYDADGRLHIMRTPISKATVNPYYGREIPGAEQLGLEPERVYYMLRDPGELAKAASSFARNQLMFIHTPVSADDPKQDSIAGTVGSDVDFEAPYLMADLCIWDAEAIAGVETETVQELSSSYRYRADMTPGMYEGQRYDGVMRDIQGNHVALVKAGRAGSDVKAADAAFNESDHPRSENGEFSNGENGGHVEKKAEPRWQINPKWKAHNDLYNEGGEGYNPYQKWLNNVPGATSHSASLPTTKSSSTSKSSSKGRTYLAPGSSIPRTKAQIEEEVEHDKKKLPTLEGFGKEIVAKGIAAKERFLEQIANDEDVTAADSKLETNMTETKFGKALYAILCAASPKLAADAALKPMVIGLTRKQCDLKALEPKLLAMDAELRKPETLAAMQAAKDAAEESERPKAKDRIARDAQTTEERAMWAQMRKDGSADDPEDDSMPASLRKAAKDSKPKRAKDLSFEEWAQEEEGESEHKEGAEDRRKARDAEEDDEDRAKRKEYEKKAEDAKKAMDASFDDLVEKLEKKGYSKEYATKVAGKVAEEKRGDCAFGAKDSKKAKDAEEEEKKKDEDGTKKAMDEFKADLRAAEEARRAVRPVVGDVLAQDSAADIYGFALDQMKVDRTGVEGVPALRALFNLAQKASKPAVRQAFDAVSVEEKFAGAGRSISVM